MEYYHADNDDCIANYAIAYATVQWPVTAQELNLGNSLTVYGQVYAAGLTDDVEYDCSEKDALKAEIGIKSSSDADYEWIAATANTACTLGESDKNNDEFQYEKTFYAAGEYTITYRFSVDGGVSWTEAGNTLAVTVNGDSLFITNGDFESWTDDATLESWTSKTSDVTLSKWTRGGGNGYAVKITAKKDLSSTTDVFTSPTFDIPADKQLTAIAFEMATDQAVQMQIKVTCTISDTTSGLWYGWDTTNKYFSTGKQGYRAIALEDTTHFYPTSIQLSAPVSNATCSFLFRFKNDVTGNWVAVDNFRLIYTDIPTE